MKTGGSRVIGELYAKGSIMIGLLCASPLIALLVVGLIWINMRPKKTLSEADRLQDEIEWQAHSF